MIQNKTDELTDGFYVFVVYFTLFYFVLQNYKRKNKNVVKYKS